MESTVIKQGMLPFSEKTRMVILELIIYLYIALFVYTAGSKLMEFDKFQKVLGRSPLIADMNIWLSWGISAVEILLSLLLIVPVTRKIGLWASLVLMIVFSMYLIWMIITGGEHLPCSCGGVVAALSWKQHIAFNIGFIGLAVFGLRLFNKK